VETDTFELQKFEAFFGIFALGVNKISLLFGLEYRMEHIASTILRVCWWCR